jgi:hypothetical protein
MPTKTAARKSRTTRCRARTIPLSANRCNFQFADGRRCRMLRHQTTGELCIFHHRALIQLESEQTIAAELLALGGEFNHPIPINFVLGKLFAHVATGRIHRRTASTLAYIAQLLLQTLDKKRYELAADQFDYRAFIEAVDLKYGKHKLPRSRRSSLGTPISRLAPSPSAAGAVPSSSKPCPSPAERSVPEPLPDAPAFRQQVFDRRRAAAEAATRSANNHAHHRPDPPARL